MSKVYSKECDLDGRSEVALQIDIDESIWISTIGDGDVMLSPDSARKLAAELIRFADEADEAAK